MPTRLSILTKYQLVINRMVTLTRITSEMNSGRKWVTIVCNDGDQKLVNQCLPLNFMEIHAVLKKNELLTHFKYKIKYFLTIRLKLMLFTDFHTNLYLSVH